MNSFSTLCPYILLHVKSLTGIRSRIVKRKYVYTILFAQPETGTTENLILCKMSLTPFVPLVCRCSDNLDKVQFSISGWQNSAYTTFTVGL